VVAYCDGQATDIAQDSAVHVRVLSSSSAGQGRLVYGFDHGECQMVLKRVVSELIPSTGPSSGHCEAFGQMARVSLISRAWLDKTTLGL